MKHVNLFILLVAAFAISGCSAVRSSQFTSPLYSTVDAPLKANIEVGNKISGSASSTTLFGFINVGGPSKFADGVTYGHESGGFLPLQHDKFGTVKEAAAFDAISKSDADLIVAPRYAIEYNDYFFFATVNATVSGYKGTIKNIQSKN